MQKMTIASTIGLGIAVTFSTVARAEDTTHKYTVQIGVSQLANKTARNATKNSGTAIGVGYQLPKKGKSGTSSVDALMTSSSGKGQKIETTGLYYSERFLASSEGKSTMKFYYGGGIGVAESKFRSPAASNGGNAGNAGDVGTTPTAASTMKTTGIAGRLLVGAQFQQGLMLELGYNLNPKVKVGTTRLNTSTLSLTLGKAF